MLIAMHQSHHWLPFWSKPRQPKELFDPKRHGNLKIVAAGEKHLARDTRLWPVLSGLHAVDMPLMAHISAFRSCKGVSGAFEYCKPLWLQITTLPAERDRRGIPIVIKDGRFRVEHRWIGSDDAGPYRFLDREDLLPDAPGHEPEYWTDYFIGKLLWVMSKTPAQAAAEIAVPA